MKALDKIKSTRKQKGISQQKMADELGVHVINYGKIENGITALTLERLYKIAQILEVSVSEIIDEQNDIVKENYLLKSEIENLKIANLLSEHEKSKVEMAVENWEELKNLRQLVTALEYLDYIDTDSFTKENAHYFQRSLADSKVLINEFFKFFYNMGKINALSRMKKHINVDLYKESTLALEESKTTGKSIEQLIQNINKLKELS